MPEVGANIVADRIRKAAQIQEDVAQAARKAAEAARPSPAPAAPPPPAPTRPEGR